jgi:PiT family inorganic phosphate transporter
MMATFGSGLLAAGVTPSFPAAIGALAGAAAWVLIATRASLPVSTTHALVGSVVGAAAIAYGVGGVSWPLLGGKVVIPLLVSPLAAFVLGRLASRVLARAFSGGGDTADCLCVDVRSAPAVAWAGAGSAALGAMPGIDVSLAAGDAVTCRRAMPAALRVTGDHLHWLSSGAVSFARGLNDAPKIVGVALATELLAPSSWIFSSNRLFVLVSAGIVLGSLVAGRRVTRVLAEDVTPMNRREGLAANLVTATLVAAGAVYGLPLSTTHVSSGGIVGMGAERGSLDWAKVREIAAAWVITLPAAALLGALSCALARALTF